MSSHEPSRHCRASSTGLGSDFIGRMARRSESAPTLQRLSHSNVLQGDLFLDPNFPVFGEAFEQRVAGLEIVLCHLSGGKPPIKRLPDLMAIQPLYSGCRCYSHDGTRSPGCRMPLLDHDESERLRGRPIMN